MGRCQNSHSRCRGFHIRQSDSSPSLSSVSNSNAHVNPSFVMDEGIYPSGNKNIFNRIQHLTKYRSAIAPSQEMPPSYDEVIRFSNHYPKVIANAENIPPPTLQEIEQEVHSITTITSQTPAIITQPQHERTRSSVN